ncbi:MAG TPA: thiamine pyrophosphate-dependent enzyme [Candidatus Limnocylindria bacterium]|nr:thiamine pyrophosphate-dependent enzyme [Candidatus Limnocylindria bacterium]
MTRYGSDIVVDVLVDLGIGHVAFNPGASFRGLHDSLVDRLDDGGPRLTMTLHEEIAVAAAHGYAKATGRPMAVALHDVVGLQHACMALFNAWCDRVPMLVLGATGPVDAARRRPWIDWIHTANVQGSHVRDFVKWDDQPMSVPAAVESVQRAYLLATTPPQAPTYVCLPVEVQEDAVEAHAELPPVRPVGRAAPDPSAIDDVLGLIADSRRPIIVADRAADRPGAFEALGELALAIGAPLLDGGARFNVATTHPNDLTGDERQVLASADLLLAFEVADLAAVLAASPEPVTAQIVDVGLSHNLVGSWAADYQRLVPVRVVLPADAGLTARALIDGWGRRGRARDAAEGRNREIVARHHALREEWSAVAAGSSARTPISTAWLAHEIGRAIGGRDAVLSNGTLNGWARRLWDLDRPRAMLGGNGGGGIGYGIGASVGAGLAARDEGRMVVNLQPDGDLLYAPSALWTMAHEALPVLTVVWNNGGYRNSEEHAERVALARSRSVDRAGIGNRIEAPAVDIAVLARAYGIPAEGPVESPGDLRAALGRAVSAVADGGPALVEVRAAAR